MRTLKSIDLFNTTKRFELHSYSKTTLSHSKVIKLITFVRFDQISQYVEQSKLGEEKKQKTKPTHTVPEVQSNQKHSQQHLSPFLG